VPAISVSTPEAVQIKRPLFACSVSVSERAARVTVTGEMDIATVPQLDAALRLAEAGSASVVLDLRGLEFMHSSAAHLLRAADRRLARTDAREAETGSARPLDASASIGSRRGDSRWLTAVQRSMM